MSFSGSLSGSLSGSYSYSQLRKLIYGPNSLTQLPKVLSLIDGKRCMIICGKSINKTNIPTRVKDMLGDGLVEHFSSMREHSPIQDINKVLSIVREKEIDTLLAIGGGSSIDAAKSIVHFYKTDREDKRGLESVAIPTTLSASEYTMYAGYTSEEGHKTGLASEYMPPKAIILDAELTMHTPEQLWLSSGIRALDHAVETLYRPNASYHLRRMALIAIKDLFTLLPLSKEGGEDIHIRQKLQLVSYMSLFPDSMAVEDLRPFGPSHTLGRKIGSSYGVPHGITSCMTLSSVVRLYQTHCKDGEVQSRLKEAAEITSRKGDLDAQIDQLVGELGLRRTLHDYNIPLEDTDAIATSSLKGLGEVGFSESDVAGALRRL
ncbi:hypothetical protein E3P92_01297 [Wallemia ichthyophaga]|nr:hypothetical protein E3P92_01297 [Wallemia ichthyophaga]